jgi:hypothetical protein
LATIGIASARQATHRASNNHLRNPEAANAAAAAAEARFAAGGGVSAAAAAAADSSGVVCLLESDEDCGNQDDDDVEYVPEKKKPAKTARLFPDDGEQPRKMAFQPTLGSSVGGSAPLGTSTNTAASSKDPYDIGPFGASRGAGGAVGMKTPANPPGAAGQGFGSHHHLSATAMGAAIHPNALTGSASGRGGGGGAVCGHDPTVLSVYNSIVQLSLRNSDGGRTLMGRSPSGGGEDGRNYNAMTNALLENREMALQYIAPALTLNSDASAEVIMEYLFSMKFDQLKK